MFELNISHCIEAKREQKRNIIKELKNQLKYNTRIINKEQEKLDKFEETLQTIQK